MTYASFCRPHRLRAVTLAIFSTVLLAGGSVMASDNLAVKTLTEQARFWENKGRTDLSSTAWKRLLQIQPNNPDALAGLAQFELDNNRMDAARALTDQLKKLPEGNSEAIKRVENATAQKAVNTPLLEQARAAAKAGRADDAVGLYRQTFDGRAISGPVALEYYQTLGGTAQGWEEARRGLEKLRADEPKNGAAGLAYAQHLTYRTSTRREGIRLLAELSREPQYARPAIDAWRKALVWLDAGQADVPLFQAYLKAQPDDGAVRTRMMSLGKEKRPVATVTVSRPDGLADGFAALTAGEVATAEQQFEKLLSSNPKNAEALGGMGVVRLKQERFADAEKLLSSAVRISGNKKWTEALNASRFWLAMQEGQARLDEDRLDLAIEAYQRAQKLDPKAQLPKVALVQALTRNGQYDQAQRFLETMEDGPDRREASQQIVKRKAINAFEAKQYQETERLVSEMVGPLDAEAQELLAWASYHQGKLAEAARGFSNVYRLAPSKSAASGLVFSHHNQKNYKELLAVSQQDKGPLRDLVPVSVQQKIAQGETRFELDRDGRLVEVDPIIILTDDVLWPATLALLRDKNPKKAYDLLAPIENKLVEIGDFSMLVVLGQAATQLDDRATAIRTLTKAAEGTDDETYYFTLAQSLIKFGRDAEAETIMLKQLETLDADGLTLLGWTQSRLGKPDQAAERFASAYAMDTSSDSAQALVYSTVQSKKFPLLLAALNKHPNGPLNALISPDVRTRIAAGEQKFGVEENARLVVLRAASPSEEQGFTLKLEPRLRSKAGVAGEGRLRQSSIVATLGWRGEIHQANLEVERQNATDSTDRAQGQRWYAKWGMKMTPNIDVQLGVGRTLSGGVVGPATVGEAGVTYSEPNGNVGVRVFQRGNEESLLALAGTPDLTTGISWGRILERGIVLSAYHKPGNLENLGYLVLSRMEKGQAVAENRKLQLYARSLWYLDTVPGLALGADVGINRFSRNLSGFELGHGGYFSPSQAVTIGAVGKYTTRLGDLDLLFLGGVGWSFDRVDAAAGDPVTGANPGKYPATSGRGIAYQGRVQGLKPLSANWSLGFGLGTQKGSGFSDWRANVFVQRRWLE